MKNSILIRKDIQTGSILSQQLLFDDATTEHQIITDLPEMVEKPGYSGSYHVDSTGKVTIQYTPIPKSEAELLKERVDEQDAIIADLMLQIAGGGK